MLLQLENSNKDNVAKLMNFARQNHLNLSLVDEEGGDVFLPGKALSNEELEKLITRSRQSGIIDMEKAHNTIRNYMHGD